MALGAALPLVQITRHFYIFCRERFGCCGTKTQINVGLSWVVTPDEPAG